MLIHNPKLSIKSIDVNLAPDFFNMSDSMCYDSGTVALTANIETKNGRKYEVTIAAQGCVKVFWHGDMYKSACQMPEELIQKFADGTIDEDNDFDCCENNWWEVMVYRDGRYIDWCGGVMDGFPNDYADENEVKDYLIEVISNDFDR
jgi:hypothetical protein